MKQFASLFYTMQTVKYDKLADIVCDLITEENMALVCAIVNQKGGVGKTTTTVNLAAYLATRGKRVLLFDLDPQGNATSGLGIEKDKVELSSYDIIIDGVSLADCLQETSVRNLKVCPSNINLAGAEVELASMDNRENRLKSAFEAYSEAYDFLLIDCPPSLGLLTLNALIAADTVLVPIQAEYYALEGVSQLMETVNTVKNGLNPELDIFGVLITMFDGRTQLANQVEHEVRKYFGDKVFKTVIPRNVRLSEAPSYGQSILEYDKRSKGAEAYHKLSREVIARERKYNKK